MIYIYICNHENNVPPPGYHHNGFVAIFMMYGYTLLMTMNQIYYAHLASVRFELSVCRGSLMTTYIYISWRKNLLTFSLLAHFLYHK